MASSIQFGGVSSGLDTKAIIDAMLAAERAPLTRLQTQATRLKTRQDAYTQLGTALNDLLAKVQAFTLTGAGSARSATSSDSARFTATAGTGAVPGLYRVAVDRLATATRATSTAAVGTAVTGATAADPMSTLPLPGTVTAGTLGLVVDGQVLSISVGDPASTSLQSVLDSIAAAVQAQVQATDGGATVTASVTGNRVQLSIAGAAADHDIRIGVTGDTSNFAAITGLSASHTADFGLGTGSISGTSLLGVVRSTTKLDDAGLTGLASTTTGKLTINGVEITYDTTVDTLGGLLSRINSSAAGVIASMDRQNDRIVLSNRTTGATAIAITDTAGTLGTALNLAPGTTAAQEIGQTSQVTVDGRTVVSATNTVTTAISGVTINLLDTSASTGTLTVGVDSASVTKSLQAVVDSFNALADKLDALTAHPTGGPAGPLDGEANVNGLLLGIRGLIVRPSETLLDGTIRSLGDLGVSTGRIGARVGTTNRLSLDTEKLASALAADPTRVAALLGSGGGITQAVVDRIKSVTKVDGMVDSAVRGIDTQLRVNADAQIRAQARIEMRQAALEAKFAALESSLSRLQTTSSSLGSQITAMSSSSDG